MSILYDRSTILSYTGCFQSIQLAVNNYFNLVTAMYIRYYFYFCTYWVNGLSTIYSYVYQVTITSVDNCKAVFGRLKLFSDHKIIAISAKSVRVVKEIVSSY